MLLPEPARQNPRRFTNLTAPRSREPNCKGAAAGFSTNRASSSHLSRLAVMRTPVSRSRERVTSPE